MIAALVAKLSPRPSRACCAAVVAAFAFAFSAAAADAATRIWIDTDPSIGAPYREVDDAFALVLAFHSPEVEIAGISTTFGNAGVKRTTAVARELVRRFGAAAQLSERDVSAGAAGVKDNGVATPATGALAAALQKQKLTYVALGPLTNLSTFVQLHSELTGNIERVIFVGGRTPGRALAFGPDGGLQIHDANVFKDPAAVRTVLDSKMPITLAAPEIGGRILVTHEAARQLANGGPAAVFLQRHSRAWLWFWTGMIGHRGAPVFDSLGVLAAARPEFVMLEMRYAGARASGELVATPRAFTGARKVMFARGVDQRATELMIERIRSDNR